MTDIAARDAITENAENQNLSFGTFYADQSLDGSGQSDINFGYGLKITGASTSALTTIRNAIAAAQTSGQITPAQASTLTTVVNDNAGPLSANYPSVNEAQAAATSVDKQLNGIDVAPVAQRALDLYYTNAVDPELTQYFGNNGVNFGSLPDRVQAGLEDLQYNSPPGADFGPAIDSALKSNDLASAAYQIMFNTYDPSSRNGPVYRTFADATEILGLTPSLDGNHFITSLAGSGQDALVQSFLTTTAQNYGTGGSAVSGATVSQYLATDSGKDFLTSVENYEVGQGYYVAQPGDTASSIATTLPRILGRSIDPGTIEALNAAVGGAPIGADGSISKGSVIFVPSSGTPLSFSSTMTGLPILDGNQAYVDDLGSGQIYIVGTPQGVGRYDGHLLLEGAGFGSPLDAGVVGSASQDPSGAIDLQTFFGGATLDTIIVPSGGNATSIYKKTENLPSGIDSATYFYNGAGAVEQAAAEAPTGQNIVDGSYKEIVDNTDGTSVLWNYAGTNAATQSVMFFSGADTTGTMTAEYVNRNDGTYYNLDNAPSNSSLSSVLSIYSGSFLTGSLTGYCDVSPDGSATYTATSGFSDPTIASAIYFYGSGTSGSVLAELEGEKDAVGHAMKEYVNYKDGHSVQWTYDPTNGNTENVQFFTTENATGTKTEEIDNNADGTSSVTIPSAASGRLPTDPVSTTTHYSGTLGMGSATSVFQNYSDGRSVSTSSDGLVTTTDFADGTSSVVTLGGPNDENVTTNNYSNDGKLVEQTTLTGNALDRQTEATFYDVRNSETWSSMSRYYGTNDGVFHGTTVNNHDGSSLTISPTGDSAGIYYNIGFMRPGASAVEGSFKISGGTLIQDFGPSVQAAAGPDFTPDLSLIDFLHNSSGFVPYQPNALAIASSESNYYSQVYDNNVASAIGAALGRPPSTISVEVIGPTDQPTVGGIVLPDAAPTIAASFPMS